MAFDIHGDIVMWEMDHQIFDNKQNLSCCLCRAETENRARENLVYVDFEIYNDKQILIKLRADNHEFLQKCKEKIRSISANDVSHITCFESTQSDVNISISIKEQIYWLNVVLDALGDNVDRLVKETWHKNTMLYNHILGYFCIVRKKLQSILQVNKEVMLKSHHISNLQSLRETAQRKENIMDIALLESSIKSEGSLRQQFDFPSPDYIWCSELQAISSLSSAPLEFAGFEDYSSDSENGNESKIDMELFSEKENMLINDFIKFLERKIHGLVENGYIKSDTIRDYWLTEKSISALKNPEINSDRHRRATRALNSIAALRSLQPNGSHSHNNPLTEIKLYGYGLRNIVALLWHCCCAVKNNESILCRDATYHDATDALIRGVANGARGKNREDNIDNLLAADLEVCIQGRYNDLITAFDTILPNVNIVYSYREALLYEFKREILRILIDHANDDFLTAERYVKLWLAESVNQADAQYNDFVAQTKKEFPNMLEKALYNLVPRDSGRREQLKETINKEVRECHKNLGMTYIEMISIDHGELEAAWRRNKRPAPTDISNRHNKRQRRRPRFTG